MLATSRTSPPGQLVFTADGRDLLVTSMATDLVPGVTQPTNAQRSYAIRTDTSAVTQIYTGDGDGDSTRAASRLPTPFPGAPNRVLVITMTSQGQQLVSAPMPGVAAEPATIAASNWSGIFQHPAVTPNGRTAYVVYNDRSAPNALHLAAITLK